MNKIKKRGIAVLLLILTLSLLTAGFNYAEEMSEGGKVMSAGAEASLLNEESAESGIKSIYTLKDYSTYDVVIKYKDGSITSEHQSSKSSLKRELENLEKDPSVESYQPDFQYTTETVQSSSQELEQMNVYYGAPGEQDTMTADLQERAEFSIADLHPVEPDDQYYYLQWGLDNDGSFSGVGTKVNAQSGIDINAPEAWDLYRAKKEVVIALVDTGVDYTNSEISGNLWVNENEIAGNGKDDDGNGYIDDVHGWNFYNNNNKTYVGSNDDHGTHCATSMVAASNSEGICGIADYSNIKVMNVKALGGKEGSGTTLSVMKAIKYAEQNGASICNLSLGTSMNDSLLYQTMKESSMLFVVAAGNSQSSNTQGRNIDVLPCYPASYTLDNIISVANLTSAGNIQYTSNYGAASVDLAAPGTDILGYFAEKKLGFMSGTSMAAPYVSAAAAMVYTVSESRTLEDTAAILKKTVSPLDSLNGMTATGGMLDLAAAVGWK